MIDSVKFLNSRSWKAAPSFVACCDYATANDIVLRGCRFCPNCGARLDGREAPVPRLPRDADLNEDYLCGICGRQVWERVLTCSKECAEKAREEGLL